MVNVGFDSLRFYYYEKNKFEKDVNNVAGEVIKTCEHCSQDAKKSSLSTYFYISYSKFHSRDGRVPLCKKCIAELSTFNGEYDEARFKEVLKHIDKPFLYNLVDSSISEISERRECKKKEVTESMGEELIGIYMKNVGMRQYNGMTWTSSQLREDELDTDDLSSDERIDLMLEWGKFPEEDLLFLDNEYQDWATRYTIDSKSLQLLIKEICHQQLSIKKAREKGQSVSKELKDLQDLMNSSALKPIQESSAMSNEANTLGVWIKKIENEEPISEVREEYKDVDGIGKMIRIFFLGHFNKMLGIKNELSEEYELEMSKYAVTLDEEDD